MIGSKLKFYHLTTELIRRYYQRIEKDLQEIVNAPSTINSIIKYYRVSMNADPIDYLLFIYKGEIYFIKQYDLLKFVEKERELDKLKYWCDSGLPLIKPHPIMFQGGFRE